MTPPSINISEALKDDRQLKSLIGGSVLHLDITPKLQIRSD